MRLDSKPFISYLAGYTQGLTVKTTQEVKSLLLLICFSHLFTSVSSNFSAEPDGASAMTSDSHIEIPEIFMQLAAKHQYSYCI